MQSKKFYNTDPPSPSRKGLSPAPHSSAASSANCKNMNNIMINNNNNNNSGGVGGNNSMVQNALMSPGRKLFNYQLTITIFQPVNLSQKLNNLNQLH